MDGLATTLGKLGLGKRRIAIRFYDIACRWSDHGPGGGLPNKLQEHRCVNEAKILFEHHGKDLPQFAKDLLEEILKPPEKIPAILPVNIDDHAFDRYRLRVKADASKAKMINSIIKAIEKGREVRLRNVTEQARKIARFGNTKYFHNSEKGFVAVVSYEEIKPRVVSIYFYDDTRWKGV